MSILDLYAAVAEAMRWASYMLAAIIFLLILAVIYLRGIYHKL